MANKSKLKELVVGEIALQTQLASMNGIAITSFQALGASISVAGSALLKFLASPVGAFVAIVALKSAIDMTSNSLSKAQEKAEESKNKYNSIASEIESMNSELETTQKRIAEINAQENISITDSEELGKLKEQNEYLQEQIELKESLKQLALASAVSDALESINKKSETEFVENKERTDPFGSPVPDIVKLDRIDSIDYKINEKIAKWQSEIDELKAEQLNLDKTSPTFEEDYNKLEDQISSNQSLIDAEKETISSMMETLKGEMEVLIDENGNAVNSKAEETVQRWKNICDEVIVLTEGTGAKIQNHLEDIMSRPIFSDISKKFEEAAKNGEDSLKKSIAESLYSNDDKSKIEKAIQLVKDYNEALANNKKALSGDPAYDHDVTQAEVVKYSKEIALLGKTMGMDFNTFVSTFSNVESVSDLTSIINGTTELSKALQDAGISAEDLYEYLSNLYNGDLLNFDSMRNSLKGLFDYDDALKKNGFRHAENDQLAWNQYFDNLSDEDLQLHFTVYLEEDTSGWTLDDFAKEVESRKEKVESNPITLSSLLAPDAKGQQSQFSKLVDDFQSDMKTLQDAKDAFNNGESIDVTDLTQEFGVLISQTDDLGKTLNDLQVTKLQEFSDKVKEITAGIENPEELTKFFADLFSSFDLSGVEIPDLKKFIFDKMTSGKDSISTNYASLISNYIDNLLSKYGDTELTKEILFTLTFSNSENWTPSDWEENFSKMYTDRINQLGYEESISDGSKLSESISSYNSEMQNLLEIKKELDDAGGILDEKQINQLITKCPKLQRYVGNLSKGIDSLIDSANDDILSDFNDEIERLNNAGLYEDASILEQYRDNLIAAANDIEDTSTKIGGMTIKTPQIEEYEESLETPNQGQMYETLQDALKKAKELYNQGLVGTDEFKKAAALFSPTGAEDAVNFAENYEKAARYITDDSTGVKNFLADLESKGYATMETMADGTEKWSYNMTDLEAAAKDMGMSFEWFMALFGRLGDYGFQNDFVSSQEEGIEHLKDLYKDLAESEAELERLKREDPTNITAIDEMEKKIEGLHGSIDTTQDAMQQLLTIGAKDVKAEVTAGKAAIESMYEELKNLDPSDENYESIKAVIEDQIRAIASKYHIELDFLLDEDELTSAYIDIIRLKELLDVINGTSTTAEVGVSNPKELQDEIDSIVENLSQLTQKKLIEIGFTPSNGEVITEEDIKEQIGTVQVPIEYYNKNKPEIDDTTVTEYEPEEKEIDIKTGEVNDSTVTEYEPVEKEVSVKTGQIDDTTVKEYEPEEKEVGISTSAVNEAAIKAIDEIVEYAKEQEAIIPLTADDSLAFEKYTNLFNKVNTDSAKMNIDGKVVLEAGYGSKIKDEVKENCSPAYIDVDVDEGSSLQLFKDATERLIESVPDIELDADINEEGLNEKVSSVVTSLTPPSIPIDGEDQNFKDVVDQAVKYVKEQNPVLNIGVNVKYDEYLENYLTENPDLHMGFSIDEVSDEEFSVITSNFQKIADENRPTVNVDGDTSSLDDSAAESVENIESQEPVIPIDGDGSEAISEGIATKNIIDSMNPIMNISANTDGMVSDIKAALQQGTFEFNAIGHVSIVNSGSGNTPGSESGVLGEACGTAHANGTSALDLWSGYRHSIGAYANGTSHDWALHSDEEALVNELGKFYADVKSI